MVAKIAGVALAAAMACGWTSGVAKADYLINLSDPAFFGFKNGDTPILSYQFSLLPNGYVDVDVSIGKYTNTFVGGLSANLDAYQIYDPNSRDFVDYKFDELDFALTASNGDSLDFVSNNLFVEFNPFTGDKIDTQVFGDFSFCTASARCITAETAVFTSDQVSGLPSTVPLPSSAPLFGAALLGLAGLGYGVKRRNQIRTA